MKAVLLLALGTVAMLMSAAPALAQRVPNEARAIQLQPRVQADVPLLTGEALEKLKLTDAQKGKYDKIDAEFKEKGKTAQEKFRADIQGLRDREKYKEAQDKLQADTKKAREDALAKVEPILTADQKTVFAQVKALQPQPGRPGVIGGVRPIQIGGGIGQVLPPSVQQRLQLTDEQKKQLEAIQKEAEAKVLKLLTDEQKKQLEQMKKGAVIRPQPIQPNPRPRIQPNPAVPAVPAAEPKKD